MSVAGTVTETETKKYEDAWAANNDRGELIIIAKTNRVPLDTVSPPETDTIAVFKEWIYWEKV